MGVAIGGGSRFRFARSYGVVEPEGMSEKENEGRTASRRVGRRLLAAVVWFVAAGLWLWTAIVSDGIAGPFFFLHLSAVCLCMAMAAHYWTSFRRRTAGQGH